MAIQQEDSKSEKIKAIHRLTSMDEWKIVEEDCQNIAKRCQEELINTPANNTLRIIELQILIKCYRNVLHGIVNSYKAEGEMERE